VIYLLKVVKTCADVFGVFPRFLVNLLESECCVCVATRDGTGSGLAESTPAGFCVFLSDPDPGPESKICEKTDPDPESLFHFGRSRSLCGHFLSKNMGKLRLDR